LLAVLARGGQFGSDCRRQARILGQAEEEIDAVQLAPAHQLLAGKPCVGAQQDAHPRPAGAEVTDNARHLCDRPGAGVDIGTAQFGRQQVPAAEDVKRQVAVAIIIAVKKPALLVPVQRVVGGIKIENDLPRRTHLGLDKQIDQQIFDRLRVVPDLVIGHWLRLAQFEPVECRFASHRSAVLAPRFKLAGQHRHDWVMAQIVMVE
jgi:hypothetical protein